MKPTIEELEKLSKDKYSETKKYLTRLKKKSFKDFDYLMVELHDNEFKKTDCLTCANCCKTTGPLFTSQDVDRIAKHLKIKAKVFVDKYLQIDEDKDFVLKELPCMFLDEQNYCSIYDVRPKACKEYPHTNRKKFQQIADLTLMNVAICPAAFNIVEELKRRIPL